MSIQTLRSFLVAAVDFLPEEKLAHKVEDRRLPSRAWARFSFLDDGDSVAFGRWKIDPGELARRPGLELFKKVAGPETFGFGP